MNDNIKQKIKDILSEMEDTKEDFEDYYGFSHLNTYADIKEYWEKNDTIVRDAFYSIEEWYDILKAVLEALENENNNI